jgi:hypothetical protein
MGPPKNPTLWVGFFVSMRHYGPMGIGQVRVRFSMGPPKNPTLWVGFFVSMRHYGPMGIGQVRVFAPIFIGAILDGSTKDIFGMLMKKRRTRESCAFRCEG